MEADRQTEQVIGAALEVHRALGPGLLESVYEQCLAVELEERGIPFERQVPMPVSYKSLSLETGYRIDLLVANALVLEIKSVEKLQPVHEAQLLTYLRLGGFKKGLLVNFNTRLLKDGIRRFTM